jgi:serine/threonine-protein kinase RsbW
LAGLLDEEGIQLSAFKLFISITVPPLNALPGELIGPAGWIHCGLGLFDLTPRPTCAIMDAVADLFVAAQVENLAEIRRFIRQEAAALGGGEEAICDLELAVDEAACNIICHGYEGRGGTIEVGVKRDEDRLVVRLHDEAPPFDPTRYPPPDVTLPLEKRPLGGLGIFLIRQAVDEMVYRTTPGGGNELTLIKRLAAGD